MSGDEDTIALVRHIGHQVSRREHTEYWYGCRIRRIRDLLKGTKYEAPLISILANGTATHTEPPTYQQQMNMLRMRAERAERALAKDVFTPESARAFLAEAGTPEERERYARERP